MAYKGKYIFTIQREHVGKPIIKFDNCTCCGAFIQPFMTADVIGQILPSDVGKQVYSTSFGVYAVENDEQMQKRLSRQAASAV